MVNPLLSIFFILAVQAAAAAQKSRDRESQPDLSRVSGRMANDSGSIPTTYQYLNDKTQKYLVNGSSIPDVTFDIGESYAGLLPVSSSGNSSLFFWFFPSRNSRASDEITVWLNGGPGDSSMNGMLLGNGPFLWQPGTRKPVPNPYAWNNLTNVVYIDQPAGTGFSPGPGWVNDVTDIAEQFVLWFTTFVTTFGLERRKVYITGESYAGHMIPYIASQMLDKRNSTYFDVRGVQIIDGVINSYSVMQQAPAVAALNYFNRVLGLNDSFVSNANIRSEKCGYDKFLSEALTYPPSSQVLTTPDVDQQGCSIWSDILRAAFEANPCFNVYHLTDLCPSPWSVMEDGPDNYFNRHDVQEALHVPQTIFKAHGGFAWSGNPGPDALGPSPSGLGPLPSVIERTNNTLITHGLQDYLLLANGTLATIQNMTWNGLQGFQEPPVEPLVVPRKYRLRELGYVQESAIDTGVGIQGTAHTERGLTFVSVYSAGHAMSQYTPGAAYRQLEFLLGRIKNLQGSC